MKNQSVVSSGLHFFIKDNACTILVERHQNADKIDLLPAFLLYAFLTDKFIGTLILVF